LLQVVSYYAFLLYLNAKYGINTCTQLIQIASRDVFKYALYSPSAQPTGQKSL